MISDFRNRGIFAGLLVLFLASTAGAQTSGSVPDMPIDARTLRVQEQAEEVYQRTDYKRAYFIYRNELAPIGDKYGQYMVGFMHLTGKGVEEDRVAASAWYRLAAERGTKEFVGARDQVLRSLDDAQRAESDRLYVELRQQYGDLVLLAKAIRDDYDLLRGRTGSRIGAGGSPVTVLEINRSGAIGSGSDYYERIERRIRARLEYISRHTEIEIVDLDVHTVDIDEIEQQIAAHASRLP